MRRLTLVLGALWLFAVLAGFPVPSVAGELAGRVVNVADGDTLTILTRQQEPIKVRLAEIDTPETGQPFGQAAKRFTGALAAGKVVQVSPRERDRYGRLVGEVFLPDGQSLNRELVRAGYAWWYRRYGSDPSLGWLEERARASRRGLWSAPGAVAPWEWRRTRQGR